MFRIKEEDRKSVFVFKVLSGLFQNYLKELINISLNLTTVCSCLRHFDQIELWVFYLAVAVNIPNR